MQQEQYLAVDLKHAEVVAMELPVQIQTELRPLLPVRHDHIWPNGELKISKSLTC